MPLMDSHSVPDYLLNLNSAQQQAILTTEGPVLILAGAGTGKTRVLTTRLAHILRTSLAYPSQVLAVTFTNRAAQEMRERIAQLLERSVDGMWLGTFHSLSVRILRRHAELVGLQSNFTILDSDDQMRLIKQILKAENIDGQYPPKLIISIINRWKDRGLTPDNTQSPGNAKDYHHIASKVYQTYQERLLILNAADFGDLLLHCLTLFKQQPDVLQSYQDQFHYLLVDEYQDTNVAQYMWLRLLAGRSGGDKGQNLCCVGDDDQSIYGWRGAEIGNILRFEKDFPGATIIRLEQNYRSTSHILGAASGLIAHNQGRLGKTLWTDGDHGEPVSIQGTWDSEAEARYIGDETEAFQRNGYALGDIAILVRAGFQTRELEERFLKIGLPYRVIGGLRFYERLEIRDALAYFRLLVQPDDGLALERIINTPRRGIGTVTLQAIHILAREQGISLPKAAHYYAENEAKGATKAALLLFFENLDRWRQLLEPHNEIPMDHAEVARMVLDESGYTKIWREDKSADSPGRLENLKELISAIKEFQYLPGFLEHVSLVTEKSQSDQQDMISIMTLHAAKGLEFKVVFLSGWEENLFPHPRALQESGQSGLEEERRLGYVGISRAKERAIITYCLQRRSYQGWQPAVPSRFIKEIPGDHVVHINQNGTEISDSMGRIATENPPKKVDRYSEKKPAKLVKAVVLHSFLIGDTVFHQKFGHGTIVDIDGATLGVEFEQSEYKKIIGNFVTKV
ncbi:MAG: UvrD-helicase domain-containing protein [Alphaproteobacteria bacterium]|nr:UvrD-helicase domain-containing protein [Alphaproteobacteria bacterium]